MGSGGQSGSQIRHRRANRADGRASRYGVGAGRLPAGVSQHRAACHDGSETARAMRGKGIEIAFAALAVVSTAALVASVAVFVLH
jgi:hypothetical protein